MAHDASSDGRSSVDQLLRVAALTSREALYIVGVGFDPRCSVGLARYIEATGRYPQVLAIDLRDPSTPSNESLDRRRSANASLLAAIASPPNVTLLPYPQVHEQAGVGRTIAQNVDAAGLLEGKKSVTVDLSALPTVVSFPVVRLLLDRCKEVHGSPNLQVLVVENPALDALISEGGTSEAAPLPGLNSKYLARSRPPGQVRVWTPVLGERTGPALDKVSQLLQPDEVCPVLPFPSIDPRRADSLVLEHRELLVDRYEVGPDGFIYADEANPFDLARSLVDFHDNYKKALEPLGVPPILCASSHSSKLLSVGVLLAANQRPVPVIGTRATTYALADEAYSAKVQSEGHVAVLWLRGDPYRP